MRSYLSGLLVLLAIGSVGARWTARFPLEENGGVRAVEILCGGLAPQAACASNWTFIDEFAPCLCKWRTAVGYVRTIIDNSSGIVTLALDAPAHLGVCHGACGSVGIEAAFMGRCHGRWPVFLSASSSTFLRAHRRYPAPSFFLEGYWDAASLEGSMAC